MNVATKAGLSVLTKLPDKNKDGKLDNVPLYHEDDTTESEPSEWATALAEDPIARCRKMVASCRASGQRREDFELTIAKGNASLIFCDTNGKRIQLDQLQLLRDVDTRWSSIFLMIERVLDLKPVCRKCSPPISPELTPLP